MQSSPVTHFAKALLLVACLFGSALTPALAKEAAVPASPAAASASGKITGRQLAATRPDVNVNQASAAELSEALLDVGPAKAKAIVDWRQKHGPFKSLDDLALVKGVGPSILQKNKAHIRFD